MMNMRKHMICCIPKRRRKIGMEMKLNKEMIGIIKDAFHNGLHIEWYHNSDDYYRYSLEQCTFTIMKKVSATEYQRVISYNILDVEAKADNSTLALRVNRPWTMSILFHASEGEE